MLRLFGFFKVPMILYTGPVVEELDDTICAIRIPLTWRTKNHYRTMYFGALAVGADCSAGMAAMYQIRKSGHNVNLLFKDMKVDFHRRPEGDVVFICEDMYACKAAVERLLGTTNKLNIPNTQVLIQDASEMTLIVTAAEDQQKSALIPLR